MYQYSVLVNGKESRNLFLGTSAVPCGERMRFMLMLGTDTVIDTVDVVFHLDFSSDALIFNNGFCTNDFVNIQKLDGEFVTRDIVMIKENDKCFSVAMTCGENYLTRFFTTKDKLIIRHYFDNLTYNAGNYPLEEFVVSEELTGNEFFSAYCDYLKEKHHIELPEIPDTGGSSWSRLYGDVTEDDVIRQAANTKAISEGATLMQVDDGWQNGSTFCADWTNSRTDFPSGIEALSAKLKENGQRLGLWFAPTIVNDLSTFFDEHYDYNIFYENGRIERTFGGNAALCADRNGANYPLDLTNEKVLEHIASSFKNAVENYDCHYFKIDFLIRSLIRCLDGSNLHNVTYNTVPAMKAYKNAMRIIREAVGKDTVLMACGAPITESIGLFQAIRTSPDITWVSSSGKRMYTYWEIVERDIQNVHLRSHYNGKVFTVDADALIVRDKMGAANDDFTPTLEEARTWATTVALSGGTVLINEEIEKLSPERIELIRQVIEPIGIAAHPEDFFEYPLITKVSLNANGKRIAARYNWDTDEKDMVISNSSTVLAFDCWSKEFLGEFNGDITVTVPPHGIRAVLLVPLPESDTVLCTTDNFYMGINKINLEKASAFVFTADPRQGSTPLSHGFITKL